MKSQPKAQEHKPTQEAGAVNNAASARKSASKLNNLPNGIAYAARAKAAKG